MNLLNKMIVFYALITTASAWAHGENKPGPHKGFIRMPGAFHVEVVPNGESAIDVYLLDISFQNPATKGSSAEVVLNQGDQVISAVCQTAKEHFKCAFPNGAKLTKGHLEVRASRLGSKGVPAKYKLPLSLSASPH